MDQNHKNNLKNYSKKPTKKSLQSNVDSNILTTKILPITLLLCSNTKTFTFLVSKTKIYIASRSYPGGGNLPTGGLGGAGKGPKIPGINSSGINVPSTISGTNEAKVEASNASPTNINHPTGPHIQVPIDEILKEDKSAYTMYSPAYFFEKETEPNGFASTINNFKKHPYIKPIEGDHPPQHFNNEGSDDPDCKVYNLQEVLKEKPSNISIISLIKDKIFKSTGEPIPVHEQQHKAILHEIGDDVKLITGIATSAKQNSITKEPNLELDSVKNLNGESKPQRVAILGSSRMLDEQIKEKVHYDKKPEDQAYYDNLPSGVREALKKKIYEAQKATIPIYRTTSESTHHLNDLGYPDEQEYGKSDFHCNKKNEEID